MHYSRSRPGFAVAAAVLLLILGTLTILGNFCLGSAMVSHLVLDVGPNPEDNIFAELFAPVDPDVAKEVPSAPYVTNSVVIIGLFLGFAMVIAGLGILKMDPRARMLGIAVALADLFLSLAHAGYHAILILPVEQRLFDEEMLNMPEEFGPFGRFLQGGMVGGLIFGVGFNLVIWLIVLYMLTSKSVRAAFADDYDELESPRGDVSRRRYDDDDDDDFGTRPPGDTGVTDRRS